MIPRHRISRRTLLRGAGAALMLPLLEQMGWADAPASRQRPPVRLCYVYFPYGQIREQQAWSPKATGRLGPGDGLPAMIEPLRPYLDAITVVTGLGNKPAAGGTHASEVASFLTSTALVKGGVGAGISCDQFAANQIGRQTVLPSLELAARDGAIVPSNKDYGPIYHHNLSWRSPTSPADKETSPRAALERLFAVRRSAPARHPAATGAAVEPELQAKRDPAAAPPSLDSSMLDTLLEDYHRLEGTLGQADRRKLAEYLDSLRSLEVRVQQIERRQAEAADQRAMAKGYAASPPIEVKIPQNVPDDFGKSDYVTHDQTFPYTTHAQLMLDIMALAFQSDSTRIGTLLLSYPYGHSYPELGFSDNHHEVSHHGKNPAKQEKFLRIQVLHAQQFAGFLKRLRSLKEGHGTLLDNCMIVYGSGMGDSEVHDNDDLPILVAGGGGGTIRGGRHLVAREPLANLHLALLARLGIKTERWGDSTRPLDLT